jgi:hypothetical protein
VISGFAVASVAVVSATSSVAVSEPPHAASARLAANANADTAFIPFDFFMYSPLLFVIVTVFTFPSFGTPI